MEKSFKVDILDSQTDAGKTIAFIYGPDGFGFDLTIAELTDISRTINESISGKSWTWIAKNSNEEIVGELSLKINDYEINKKGYYLVSVVVHKDWRKLGIANLLMEELDKFLISVKAKYCYLYTGDGESTAAARKMYVKYGYGECGSIAKFFEDTPGNGLTVMVKYYDRKLL